MRMLPLPTLVRLERWDEVLKQARVDGETGAAMAVRRMHAVSRWCAPAH